MLRYLPKCEAEELIWRREGTGEIVDLTEYQAEADGVRARSTDTPDIMGCPD